MYSTVLIIPAALLTKANALGAALGHGPESYTVPLSGDGETVTHYGAHAVTSDTFIGLIVAAGGGDLPAINWSEYGLTVQDVGAVLAAMTISAPGSALDAVRAVDVNSADSALLQTLDGVGPVTASAIIAGRPWAALSDLDAIDGLTGVEIDGWGDTAFAGPRQPYVSASDHFGAVLTTMGLNVV